MYVYMYICRYVCICRCIQVHSMMYNGAMQNSQRLWSITRAIIVIIITISLLVLLVIVIYIAQHSFIRVLCIGIGIGYIHKGTYTTYTIHCDVYIRIIHL